MPDTARLLTQPSSPQSAIRGTVITAYRFYKGNKLGPYYFRKWKVGRKVYKQYIKPEDVEKVRTACQSAKQKRKETNRFLDNVDFLRKMCERYDRGKAATPEQEAYILRLHNEGHYITGRPIFRPRRVFGAPFFSKFIDFLPSGSELKEIARINGAGAVIAFIGNAKKAWQRSIYDQIFDRAIKENFPPKQNEPSRAMGWMQPSS